MDITQPAPPAENLQRIHVVSELGHHNYYHYCRSDSEHADLDLKIDDSVYAFVFSG